MMADLRAFWRSASLLPRAALAVLAAAVAAHALSLLGVGWEAVPGLWVSLHLAVMALVLALFAGGLYEAALSPRRSFARDPVPVPRHLVGLSVVFVAYAIAWLVGSFLSFGEGAAELRDGRYVWVLRGAVAREITRAEYRTFDARMLSVFSAGWCAFALPLALRHHQLAVRIRRRRAERRAPAA
jgi:hypothetical protein